MNMKQGIGMGFRMNVYRNIRSTCMRISFCFSTCISSLSTIIFKPFVGSARAVSLNRRHTQVGMVLGSNLDTAPNLDTGSVKRMLYAHRSLTMVKVLLLHGFGQNADIIVRKTGPLRRLMRRFGVEIIAMNAPFAIDPAWQHAVQASENTFSWWRPTFNKEESRWIWSTVQEWEHSLERVKKLWMQHEFIGVVGFSQGAGIAGILCALANAYAHDIKLSAIEGMNLDWLRSFKFALIFSGFVVKSDTLHDTFMQTSKIDCIQSMHVYGAEDKTVISERSEMLISKFQYPKIYVHAGGHHIPQDHNSLAAYKQFLETVIGDHEKGNNIQNAL